MRHRAGTSLALFTMVLALFAAPLAAGAEQAGKVWHIGYLALGLKPAGNGGPVAN